MANFTRCDVSCISFGDLKVLSWCSLAQAKRQVFKDRSARAEGSANSSAGNVGAQQEGHQRRAAAMAAPLGRGVEAPERQEELLHRGLETGQLCQCQDIGCILGGLFK